MPSGHIWFSDVNKYPVAPGHQWWSSCNCVYLCMNGSQCHLLLQVMDLKMDAWESHVWTRLVSLVLSAVRQAVDTHVAAVQKAMWETELEMAVDVLVSVLSINYHDTNVIQCFSTLHCLLDSVVCVKSLKKKPCNFVYFFCIFYIFGCVYSIFPYRECMHVCLSGVQFFLLF